MQKWIIKKFHFIGCNLYLLPDMRKSQLLYISAVTICLLGNGMSAAGSRHRSQAEPALQSRWPATVAGSRVLVIPRQPPHFTSPRAQSQRCIFFLFAARRGDTRDKKREGDGSCDRDLGKRSLTAEGRAPGCHRERLTDRLPAPRSQARL